MRFINIVRQSRSGLPQFLIRILVSCYDCDDAMKTNRTNQKTDSGNPQSRPPPAAHPSNEPEYDTEQVTRRASAVTGVLERILHEGPGQSAPTTEPPRPGTSP